MYNGNPYLRKHAAKLNLKQLWDGTKQGTLDLLSLLGSNHLNELLHPSRTLVNRKLADYVADPLGPSGKWSSVVSGANMKRGAQRAAVAVGSGLVGAGALYGGKKLYDRYNEKTMPTSEDLELAAQLGLLQQLDGMTREQAEEFAKDNDIAPAPHQSEATEPKEGQKTGKPEAKKPSFVMDNIGAVSGGVGGGILGAILANRLASKESAGMQALYTALGLAGGAGVGGAAGYGIDKYRKKKSKK